MRKSRPCAGFFVFAARLLRANKAAVRLTRKEHRPAGAVHGQSRHHALRILSNLHLLPALQRAQRLIAALDARHGEYVAHRQIIIAKQLRQSLA